MAKKFNLPESLGELDLDALSGLREEAVSEIEAINSQDGDFSDEQIEDLEALMGNVDSIDAQATELTSLAQEREARIADIRGRADSLKKKDEKPADNEDEAPGEDPAPEGGEEPVVDPPADEEDPKKREVEPVAAEAETDSYTDNDAEGASVEDVTESAEEKEPVLASGNKRSVASQVARHAPAVDVENEEKEPLVSITAAANVPDFNSGQSLKDMTEVAQAFSARTGGYGAQNPSDMGAQVYSMSPSAARHGVARIRRQDREHTVDRNMSVEQQFAVIREAASESRLQGGGLIAAGTWCAPSETIYEMFGLETTEGLLDLPEVTARRGGISFTKGPTFGDLFTSADFGFLMTEAEVEAAATPKPCYAVDCPPFEEVRMDATGFCITAGLLTNVGYPELIRRVLDLGGVAHARSLNADTIARIKATVPTGNKTTFAPVTAAGSNSGTSDLLDGVELMALRIRQTFAMSPNATVEGFAPYWVLAVLRADLGRRLGVDSYLSITDEQVRNFFAVRGIRLQFVYDDQMLTGTSTGTWTAYPDTVDITMYPAGAFTRLTNDVINLDAVYDHDNLTNNTYTAAFFEEGTAVANTVGEGFILTAALNTAGAVGYPVINAPAAV